MATTNLHPPYSQQILKWCRDLTNEPLSADHWAIIAYAHVHNLPIQYLTYEVMTLTIAKQLIASIGGKPRITKVSPHKVIADYLEHMNIEQYYCWFDHPYFNPNNRLQMAVIYHHTNGEYNNLLFKDGNGLVMRFDA